MKNYSVKSFIPTQVFPAIPLPDHALRLALLYQLEHSQWWKEADIKKTQYGQIKKILDHAYQTVPYLTATELDINIRQFQCVQHSLKLVEFKLVMDCKMTEEQERKAVKLMQTVLGHPFEIKFTYLNEIPRGSNGKFQEFISLVSGQST